MVSATLPANISKHKVLHFYEEISFFITHDRPLAALGHLRTSCRFPDQTMVMDCYHDSASISPCDLQNKGQIKNSLRQARHFLSFS